MTSKNEPAFLDRPDGTKIAYQHTPAASPADGRAGVLFCGGLMSDMTGTKALALEAHCRARGLAYTRFDYRGHGQSDGVFHETVLGEWLDDATAVLDQITGGPMVVVGSSMGGWVMLLLALARPERTKALIGIAPAPDFVEAMWAELEPDAQAELQRTGYYRRPSDYSDEPYVISMALIEDGRKHLLLDKEIPINCPVRILQGMQDPDVPWRHALKVAEKLQSDDVIVTLAKSGDHRLSTPDDLARLIRTVDELVGS